MRRAMRPAICLQTTRLPAPSIVSVFCSFCSEASSLLAIRNRPRRYSTFATAPPIGARLTCTSNTFRKMLMRVPEGPLFLTATILPSAGDTATGPAGIKRSGSRKKYRQNAASTPSGSANAGPASQNTRAAPRLSARA